MTCTADDAPYDLRGKTDFRLLSNYWLAAGGHSAESALEHLRLRRRPEECEADEVTSGNTRSGEMKLSEPDDYVALSRGEVTYWTASLMSCVDAQLSRRSRPTD